MRVEEDHNKRKGQIALRAGVVLAFLFALTWGLPSSFNWIFFWSSGYAFFLYWYYQPRQEQFERKSEFEFREVTTQERVEGLIKKVVRISGILIFGLFAIFFVIGIFSRDDESALPDVQGEGSDTVVLDEATDWNGTGYDFYLNKQYDSALYYFERVLRLESGNGTAWYNKGLVFYDQQITDKALESFSRAYEAGVRDAFLSHVLGYLNDNSGNTSRALSFYKEAIGMDSSRTDIYARLAELEPSRADQYKAMEERWKN